MRALAAQPGFLHAAEGRDIRSDRGRVDADHAIFQRLGDAEDAADVTAVEVAGEADWVALASWIAPPRS